MTIQSHRGVFITFRNSLDDESKHILQTPRIASDLIFNDIKGEKSFSKP